MNICLFDPGLENNQGLPSANLGDLIIQEAVQKELRYLFSNSKITQIATHTLPSDELILEAFKSTLVFVGGTNLLSSEMGKGRKWRFSFRQQIKLNKSILKPIMMGVGWQRYESAPDLRNKLLLKALLSNKYIHSLRDEYTKEQLRLSGIVNTLNTGCPTMWPFIDWDNSLLPNIKSENVLLTLTDYSKNQELDKKLLELLGSKYKKIFVWPQGRGDREYISALANTSTTTITMLEHSFEEYKSFLNSSEKFDYVGTRLHGGVKCLLSNRRSLIIEIDNRAKEIARDTNLPISERDNFEKISNWIESPKPVNIKMNREAINQWRSQFKRLDNLNKSYN